MLVLVGGVIVTVLTMIPVMLQLRQHPRGLVILFFAEMWERFSYYGMRGLLILYLTQKFLFDQSDAADHYGAYVALMYLMPLVGGVLADRWLGTRKAIQFGAVLLVIGQLGLAVEGPSARQVVTYQGHDFSVAVQGRMADRTTRIMVGGQGYSFGSAGDGALKINGLPAGAALPPVLPKGSYSLSVKDRNGLFLNLFYLALAANIMGVGYLKANISSIVGQLYPQGDPRRDPGFTLYYFGINLGSFWAGILPGLVGATVGWWAGFGLGAIGMAAGLLVFVLGRPLLQGVGEPPVPERLKRPTIGAINLEWSLYLAGLVGIGVAFLLVGHNAWVQTLLIVSSILVLGYVGWYMAFRCNQVERERLGLAMVLIAGSVVFWTLFEQAGTSLNLFADSNVNLSIGAFAMTVVEIRPGADAGRGRLPAPGLWRALRRRRIPGAADLPGAGLPAAHHRRALPVAGRPFGGDQAGPAGAAVDDGGGLVSIDLNREFDRRGTRQVHRLGNGGRTSARPPCLASGGQPHLQHHRLGRHWRRCALSGARSLSEAVVQRRERRRQPSRAGHRPWRTLKGHRTFRTRRYNRGCDCTVRNSL